MPTRTNDQWLAELSQPGDKHDLALADLRTILLRGLPFALARYLSPADPQFSDLLEEVAQDSLLKILANLDSFEGRSRFTTWAHKIAIRVALSELRRSRWKDISLEEMQESAKQYLPGALRDTSPLPEVSAERADVLRRVEAMMREELTDRQMAAMRAALLNGIPMSEVARRMGMERNALYKLLHDARLKLKRRLARDGLTPAGLLAIFDVR